MDEFATQLLPGLRRLRVADGGLAEAHLRIVGGVDEARADQVVGVVVHPASVHAVGYGVELAAIDGLVPGRGYVVAGVDPVGPVGLGGDAGGQVLERASTGPLDNGEAVEVDQVWRHAPGHAQQESSGVVGRVPHRGRAHEHAAVRVPPLELLDGDAKMVGSAAAGRPEDDLLDAPAAGLALRTGIEQNSGYQRDADKQHQAVRRPDSRQPVPHGSAPRHVDRSAAAGCDKRRPRQNVLNCKRNPGPTDEPGRTRSRPDAVDTTPAGGLSTAKRPNAAPGIERPVALTGGKCDDTASTW